MSEIDWLDKIQANFKEVKESVKEYLYPDLEEFNTLESYSAYTGPMSVAGRMALAEELIASGLVTSPEEYMNIINNGEL